MELYDSVLDMVGRTPLFRLPLRSATCELFLKLEKFNPGQSVKDRAAKNMIVQAELAGRLKPGDTIVESSSGNTGISLAMLAASRGYRFVCVVDNHVTPEKIDLLRAYGAVIEHVGLDLPPDYHAAQERLERVEELCAENPTAFFIDQGHNLDNRGGHYLSTAPEIIEELGSVDWFFASVGTGGSVSGAARRLREHNPDVYVVAVEPAGSVIFGRPYAPFFQSGAGSARLVWPNTDFSVIDEGVQATDAEAFNTARYFARRIGLLVGGSSGALIFKALETLTARQATGIACALVPDGGERYISTVFNDQWMTANNLVDPEVDEQLDRMIDHEVLLAAGHRQTRNSRGSNSVVGNS